MSDQWEWKRLLASALTARSAFIRANPRLNTPRGMSSNPAGR